MKKFVHSMLIVGILLLTLTGSIIALAQQDAGETYLNREEFISQIVGRTITVKEWSEYILVEGKTRVNYDGRRFNGSWKFTENGVICFKYVRLTNANGCYHVRLGGNGVQWLSTKDGRVIHTTTLKDGDQT